MKAFVYYIKKIFFLLKRKQSNLLLDNIWFIIHTFYMKAMKTLIIVHVFFFIQLYYFFLINYDYFGKSFSLLLEGWFKR